MKHLKLLLALLMLNTFLYSSEEVPTQEEVAKLYVATFNRAPDSAGLTYWTNGSGLKLSGIASSFFDQPETTTLYPAGTSNVAFITSVYQNLFNRLPDTDGLNYWEAELNAGSFTKNRFIEAVIAGAQNTATSNDADILANKTTVGLSFSEAGLENSDDAKTIMNGVSDDDATMDAAITLFGISLFSNTNENLTPEVCGAQTGTYDGGGTFTHEYTADGKFEVLCSIDGSGNSAGYLMLANNASELTITQVTKTYTGNQNDSLDTASITKTFDLNAGTSHAVGSSALYGAFNCVETYDTNSFNRTINYPYELLDLMQWQDLTPITTTCPAWFNHEGEGGINGTETYTSSMVIMDSDGGVSNVTDSGTQTW